MDFSFGIVTGGEDYSRIIEIIESIHNQNIEKYEILIVGGHADKLESEVNDLKTLRKTTLYPFDESIRPRGWISKKKNIITACSKYSNVVYMHDYHVLQKDWYKNFLDFGDDWDVCMNSILNVKGARFRDWITWDHPELGRQAELDYDDDTKVKHQYISGGYWVAKQRFMLFNPIDENYCRGTEYEDVEWSKRIRDRVVYKMNKNSVVKHNKNHRETDTRGYFAHLKS